MDTFLSDEELRRGLLIGGLLAVVWAAAATVQPTSTYHLAPILIAGAVPALARRRGAALSRVIFTAAGGALLAAIAAVGLATFDLLQGPTLLPYGDAFAEALSFTAAGAIVGAVIGWLLPAS